MVNCPNCDAVVDADPEDLGEGDVLTCDECGATLNVTSLDPLELEVADDDDDDEDDDDFDFDEDEDEDEDEEEEEEEDEWK